VVDEDLRFFLALLLTMEERESLPGMVRSRKPDADPIDTALAWLSELLDLGIDMDTLNTKVVSLMLNGAAAAQNRQPKPTEIRCPTSESSSKIFINR
jgi:hypothetical protein